MVGGSYLLQPLLTHVFRGNQERKKIMQKINNKSGLALGSIFALVASAFVGLSPATAANETSAVIAPTGAGLATQNSMLITETFETILRYGTGVVGALTGASSGSGTVANASIQVSANSTSAVLDLQVDGDGEFSSGAADLILTSVSSTVAAVGYKAVPSTSAYVSIGLAGLTSLSPAVDVTVTPFLDIDGLAGLTAGDSVGDPYVISFVPWSALAATVSVTDPVALDRGATASVTVTAGTIRWSQLNGAFGVAIDSTGDTSTGAAGTISADVDGSPTARTGAEMVTANYSFSAAVATAPLTTSGVVQSVSARLFYFDSAPAATANPTQGLGLTALATKAVAALGVDATTISPVAGDNIKRTGANTADARFNSAFVLTAYPYSASITTSVAVASAFTVSAVGAGIEFDADSGVILNGTTYTSSAAFAAAGFTLAAGATSVPVSTFGQSETGATDVITFALTSQLRSNTLAVTLKAANYDLAAALTNYASLIGTSKTFDVSVEDQWGVSPVRTDMRVAASVTLGGSTSATVSALVVAGEASVAVAPTPATRTGSAVVTFTLQTFNQATQAWDTNTAGTATDTVTWNVYSYAAGTDSITSRTVSISASISYGVALSYSTAVIAVGVTNSFSDVTVAAPGLIIMNSDETTVTASDTLTVAANGKTANFKFTSRLAGTYTVTITNGTASTTSTVIVNPAYDYAGTAITFDTTAIAAGSTATVTGTLVDANGNPVHTSGSATIAVTYVGAGIPIGTMPTETDEDGEFSFTVLTGANDKGTATVTAVYSKFGAATATADKLTAAQPITIGGAAAVVTPSVDQKLTIGTFNGYIAIYAKGYAGQKLSYKVAGKWGTVPSLSAFQRVVRKTGAGYEIMVDLYVDGVKVKSETVTTK